MMPVEYRGYTIEIERDTDTTEADVERMAPTMLPDFQNGWCYEYSITRDDQEVMGAFGVVAPPDEVLHYAKSDVDELIKAGSIENLLIQEISQL